jgi:hypothetical protein
MDDGYTTAWLLWIGMFFVIEIPALANKRQGDTLSEHVVRWGAVKGKPSGWLLRRLVLLLFLIWQPVHFLTDWL